MRTTLLLLVLAMPWTAHAYDLEHDSDGSQVRWAGTLTLYVDAHSRTVSQADVLAAMNRAAQHWATIAAVDVSVESESEHGTPGYDPSKGEDNRSEVIFEDDEWDYDPDVAATTLVTMDTVTHQILDADILVNEWQNRFGILPDDSKSGQGLLLDLEGCLTHELGHALGLAHTPDHPEATMFGATLPGEISKRELAKDDEAGVQFIYGTPGNAKHEPTAGCSSGVGPEGLAILFAAVILLWRGPRRRDTRMLMRASVFAGLAVMVAASAWAEGSGTAQHLAPKVEKRVQGQVTRTLASWQGGRIYTDVEVNVETCVEGTCNAVESYRVPGGTIGRIRQVLADVQVPVPGDHVDASLIRATDGRLKLSLRR